MNNKDIALSLIDTKEFLTDAEKDIVFSYSPDLVWQFLNKIEDNRWLNINVYCEREDEKYDD